METRQEESHSAFSRIQLVIYANPRGVRHSRDLSPDFKSSRNNAKFLANKTAIVIINRDGQWKTISHEFDRSAKFLAWRSSRIYINIHIYMCLDARKEIVRLNYILLYLFYLFPTRGDTYLIIFPVNLIIIAAKDRMSRTRRFISQREFIFT